MTYANHRPRAERRAPGAPPRLLSLTLTLASAPTLAPGLARADCDDGRPTNSGHRGTGNSSPDNPFPENTIPSLLAAQEEGATFAEIDVQLSLDGVPVLMHDTTVDNTTDGDGCVTELTVDKLKELDAGHGTPMAGRGVQVPTLAEVLAEPALALDLHVEIKYWPDACPLAAREEVAAAVVEVLAADPLERQHHIISFDPMLLQAIRDLDPEAYVGYSGLTFDILPIAEGFGFDAINVEGDAVLPGMVEETHAAGLEFNVWTVDDPEAIEAMFAYGVDSIITNEPPEVETVRAALCDGGGTGTTGTTSTGGTGTTGATSTGAETDTAGATTSASTGETGASTGMTGMTGMTESTGPADPTTTSPTGDGGSGCACRAQNDTSGGPLLPSLLLLSLAATRSARRRAR